MLTVREALDMKPFHSSQVVAGREGLDHTIQWVHIVDIPDAHYEWKREGVLLLTAGFGLSDRSSEQADLITTLHHKGFAGLVLSTGHYFDHAPPRMKEVADELGFPIIESPPDVLFIDITEAILEEIVNQQYTLLQKSNRIHQQLTEIVLQGGDLQDAAHTLSNLLQRSVTIEDTSQRMLASSLHGPVDPARQRSIEEGRTTPEVAQWVRDNVYDVLLQEMSPVHIPPKPELQMTMERFVAPIIVDRRIHAYIWIIAGDHPLTDLDELAIQHGATVAALILFKEQAVRNKEQEYRKDFLSKLLENDAGSSAFQEQAQRLNYDPDRLHQALLIQIYPPPEENQRNTVFDAVNNRLNQLGTPHITAWRKEGLVVILESDQHHTGVEAAQAIQHTLVLPEHNLMLGVGKAGTDVRSSLLGAREALDIARSQGGKQGIFPFHDLGILYWLHQLPPDVQEENPYLEYIHRLAAYDRERKADLVLTLETYLDHGSSLVDAAAALHIHRNTLMHRLERIEELLSVDLHQPDHRLNLHVALKSYRLNSR